MSRHHRAHKRGWEEIRKRAIAVAQRRCQQCGRPGRLEVHHPVPLSAGGDNDQALVVMCRDCHFVEHHTPDPAREAWAKFLVEEFSAC